jgi:acetoin utilization deacetylase AcuC-like enzyme
MPLTLVTSNRFADHVTPPGHPERIERAEVMQAAAARWSAAGGAVASPRAATDEELARVHAPAYVAGLVELRGRATMIDEDTFTSPESEEVARLAAGAALTAVDHVLDGPVGTRAIVLARPPGHHAERDRAMGFCLYNSIAVAAASARARGLPRVAIVDYDVHHGNGTQAAFYDDPAVLFVSSHQFPFYPGTGAAGEIGSDAGRGFTVNVPLEAGATDADYDLAFRDLVVPVVRAFRPELLLVSAGFDAHEQDPLASMRMTTAGYARLTGRLLAIADEVCGGRVVFVTEGGYDTNALAACLDAIIALASKAHTAAVHEPPLNEVVQGNRSRGEAAAREVRRHQAPFWPV